MTNNDIMRRIRYTFNFDDSKMIAIFAAADFEATRAQISDLLKKEDAPDYKECNDKVLAIFLNGFINERRGKKEGEQSEPEEKLTNNIIFTKIKIALNLKSDEILDILNMVEVDISKHELSAFFRKSTHKNFRACQDQVLRKFLKGMQLKYRTDD
ncbi:Glutamate synthase [NADPH] large chain [hydrothermal vent metagenome]|uniref:Glutamate synthase [NADPH] large chain n=1 Tax=hydrothermal vent metagenome TaxID=652676 RepID=A0A3B1AKC0_9ZZZZ